MDEKLKDIKINANTVKDAVISENKPENSLSTVTVDNTVNDIIIQNAKNSNNVKSVIDLAATSKALQNEKTVDKIVNEKTQELITDAEKKKIESETDKIRQEAEKVKKEQEKQIAELDKIKTKLEGEIANLKAEDNKAQAFFDSNKSILKCVGVREKLSLKAMQWLMVPAGIVFTIFQIILLPFSLVGFAIESLMNIVGAVCGKIAKSGWKIALSILTTVVIVALLFGCYYAFTHWIVQLF
ncbi:MAG: hypothetical protein RR342_01005 [Bacilli bacterium]